MADYIDRNELVGNLDRFALEHLTPLLRSLIAKQPTADVVEVKHGEWVDNGIQDSMLSECSLCGFPCGAYTFNYCPNCGAKMQSTISQVKMRDNERTRLRRFNMLILKILGIAGLLILGSIGFALATFGFYMLWQFKDGIF